jgi:DNA-binding response OmpR family regulator
MVSDCAQSTGRPDLSRITALVIDNDSASIQLLQACLQPFGARVLSARSASEGKHVIESEIPDIVICDLALPDQSGLEFIRWLRARSAGKSATTPAIAVTFFYERFGERETRAAGFDMFVRKPIEPMEIVHAVTLLVRRSAPS